MFLLGVLLLSAMVAARWPDRITVDARGVSWVDESGVQQFFENEHALVVTGAIPWVRSVVCDLSGARTCSKPNRDPYFLLCQLQCINMECNAVPSTQNIEISYDDVHYHNVIQRSYFPFSPGSKPCEWENDIHLNPEKFSLNLRAVPSLSLLWHIK